MWASHPYDFHNLALQPTVSREPLERSSQDGACLPPPLALISSGLSLAWSCPYHLISKEGWGYTMNSPLGQSARSCRDTAKSPQNWLQALWVAHKNLFYLLWFRQIPNHEHWKLYYNIPMCLNILFFLYYTVYYCRNAIKWGLEDYIPLHLCVIFPVVPSFALTVQ